jgi:hypothetical protein
MNSHTPQENFVMKRLASLLTALLVIAAVLVPQPAAAQGGAQWRIDFFNNMDWAGAPANTQFSGQVVFNWGSDIAPAPFVASQFWSARFTTGAFFNGGLNRFTIQADDEFVLFVNGISYFDSRGRGLVGKPVNVDIPLTQGQHFVQIDFRQQTGPAFLFVNWSFLKDGQPSGNPVPQPPAPQPPPAVPSNLSNEFGDFSRCARERLHQSECFRGNGQWDGPNLGSIQMEPQILIWELCEPNRTTNMRFFPNQDPQPAICSRTGAGWFPR